MTYTEQELDALFAWEESAYEYAKAGDYAEAIEIWAQLLADAGYHEYFTAEALKEMAYNLGAAYFLNGDEAAAETLLNNWGLGAELATIRAAVTEPAETR